MFVLICNTMEGAMIYRGYDIVQTVAGWTVMKDGVELYTAKSEDAALSWVDATKRAEARAAQQ